MVIDKEKKPKHEPVTDIERRRRLLQELEKKRTDILELSLVYAEMLELTTADITRRWKTAEEQYRVLQDIYNRGYEDGFHEKEKRL